jgi:hypothetical protein
MHDRHHDGDLIDQIREVDVFLITEFLPWGQRFGLTTLLIDSSSSCKTPSFKV